MLGWMLKRGENAPDADAGDTTQLDQPDTPAPVFAARAFRSALFGTPAPANSESRSSQDKMATRKGSAASERGPGTPPKPPGILLTPGTGTSRRKRVSFGHDVAGTTKAGSRNETAAAKDGGNMRRARVAEALENSRQKGSKKVDTRPIAANNSEDEWEEEVGDDFCAHDMTLDLNEPHSQSGRYWKEEFEKYHQEAKAEMEKLLKYKQLAKSYAQQKDAEAIQLAERLRDEQQRVIKMEKRIAQNASQIVLKHRQSSDAEPTELLSKLIKQTALAAQYRHRVQELEDELDAFLRQKGGDGDAKGQRRRQTAASPTTQKTLAETQRELRRARTQLKELDSLRKEISSLKARVQVAEAQAIRDETDDVGPAGGSRARGLRAQLKQAKEECKKKDEEMLQLKNDFESFRKESEVHEAETKAVLERAHTKISDLKKEIKTLKATGSEQARPNSWHAEPGAGQETGSGAKAEGPIKQPVARSLGRRKFDSVDEDGDYVYDAEAPGLQSRSAREKFQEDADFGSKGAPSALTERPNLDKPRWQPFVPRSPRNRAYLGEDLERRIRNGGATPAATKMKGIAAPDLPGLAKAVSRNGKPEKSRRNGEVDLLQDRFARLGGPDANLNGNRINSSMVGNTSKSTLPPERRAAALARIEQRMAEKKRSQRRKGHDKENVRP
ncbi:hypothetical protein TOPH_01507 [Tolypocladium ophioglossoides CBS 100239]|uniref:Spindle pole body-associated protein cut12 domain-containing protein n=1 Tax=Tolypocladium ophioglossoides (strain CBS 100239) TaxID=1163406 RepID=A0A0L0NIU7_TOLOC|nr:hypothetical protein TOPH_01507 [Tolypocladium ophioglossoides CBS 100239]